MRIKEKEILEQLNSNKEDITNFDSDIPTEQGTVEKNTFLINHIRDNFEKDVPADMRDEMYETLMNMTERKLLESSNIFNYIIAGEMEEKLDKLFDGIIAMHGVVIQLMMKFGDEISEELAPEHRGILNVLHFGRTNQTLPTPEELSAEMKDFNKNPKKSKTSMKRALLPSLVQNAQKLLHDIKEQTKATGIYVTSKNEKVIKGAINHGMLRRLFLPMQNGNGVYAVKTASQDAGGNDSKEMFNDLMDKLGDLTEDEVKDLVENTINKIKKEDKN